MIDFKLRPWTIDDLDSLVLHANNFNIAKFMSDGFPHPYSIENGKTFIELATKGNSICFFAIDINGNAVGGIGIHLQNDIHKKNAELGYWLAEKYWGNGIITKAIKEITDYAFKTYDINRIFARPFGTNAASHKVLEKAEFKLEARFEKVLFKNGEYADELIYAIRR